MNPASKAQALYKIKERSQTVLKVNCVNSNTAGVNCPFVIRARRQNESKRHKSLQNQSLFAKITSLNLFHRCQSTRFIESLQQQQQSSLPHSSNTSGIMKSSEIIKVQARDRSVATKQMKTSSVVLQTFHVGTNLKFSHTLTASDLRQMVSNENTSRVPTKSQAAKFVRSFNKDTFKEHMKQFACLPSFLETCSISDPNGIYVMNLKPLGYKVKGLEPSPSNLMFDFAIIIPSASKTFFSNSNKICIIDGAHMYTKWEGILLSIVAVDAEGGNVPLGVALVPQENKMYWEFFFYTMISFLPHPHMVMSDKAKGLESIRNAVSNLANVFNNRTADSMITTATVFALCALHAMRNAMKSSGGCSGKSGKSITPSQITSLARAPTDFQFDIRLERIRTTASPNFFKYIESHTSDFTYMGLHKNQGLLTNYGLVTNNPVEQSNNHFAGIRSSPVVDMFQTFIINQGILFTKKLKKALEYQNEHNCTVVPQILSVTKDLAQSLHNALWTNTIINFQQSTSLLNNSNITTITYVVSTSSTVTSSELKSYQVTITNDCSKKWSENIVCPCNWTLSTKRPCKHAAFYLCFPSVIDVNKKIKRHHLNLSLTLVIGILTYIMWKQ